MAFADRCETTRVSGKRAALMLRVGHPGGLCNRLDVITTAYFLAARTGETAIEVLWPVDDYHMPVAFNDLFTSLPHGDVIEREIDLQVLSDYYSATAILPANYRESRTYGTHLKALLTNVVPEVKAEVSAFVTEVFLPLTNSVKQIVGVHIRRSERPLPICEFAQPLTYYEALIKSFPTETRFFVSTDSQEAFQWLQSRCSPRIFQRPKIHDDRTSPLGIREGLVDMLLLSHCNAIVGTWRSSFSHLAALAGERPMLRVRPCPDIPANWPSFSRWRWMWAHRHFVTESTFWRRCLYYLVRPHFQRVTRIPAHLLRMARLAT